MAYSPSVRCLLAGRRQGPPGPIRDAGDHEGPRAGPPAPVWPSGGGGVHGYRVEPASLGTVDTEGKVGTLSYNNPSTPSPRCLC